VHLVVVEDDAKLAGLLARLLRRDRHVVEVIGTGEEALETLETLDGVEAVILDVGLPGISGIEVAQRLRRRPDSPPILMLTARDAVDDRVAGLDAGADDYLVKPFAYEELAARVRALARRGSPSRPTAVLRSGPISLDDRTRQVMVAGRPRSLTQREFALLECLLRHNGQALSRDQLLDHAWPYGSAVTPNSVDVYVSSLRAKLGEAGRQIETVRGFGYRLARTGQSR
jgi:two-component system, OmpR family, response regulator